MMRLYHFFCFLLVIFASVAASVSAGDWPDNPDGVTGIFAAPRDGGFVPGLEFAADGQRVTSWSDGEIIWFSGTGYLEGAVPGDGSVVMEHPGGFRSTYKNVEVRPDSGDLVDEGQWIGYAGQDAWQFVVTDSERGKAIDPITLLPTRKGLERPVIGDAILSAGGKRLVLADGMDLAAGRWDILLDAGNPADKRAVPVEISLFWVGERVGFIRLDSLEERDGKIVVDSPDPVEYQEVYNSDGNLVIRGILLNAGRGILELRISDEAGQVIRRAWNLSIRSR